MSGYVLFRCDGAMNGEFWIGQKSIENGIS